MKKIPNNPAPQYNPKAPYVISTHAEGGFLQPKDAWDALSMAEKSEMMKVAIKNGIYDLSTIRKKYNEFAEGGSKEEVVNTDEQYLTTMERVAEENYRNWGYNNPDEALLHALNDNTYNYRDYYNKYPQSRANADTHWTDEFKTVYHPTFSNESIYSGQKSQYNPLGLPGGFWVEESFVPRAWQIDTNIYEGGGYTSSDSIRKRIAKHEGAAMTGAKDPLSGKFLKNRSFESEDRSFYRALPESIRDKVLANQELADNLYSYSYNVGAGNFKKRVVPTLEKFYQGKAMIKDIEDSMWASGDSKLRGLRIRRAQEKEGVRNALSPKVPDLVVQPVSTAVFNPYIPQAENTVIAPVMVPDEDSYITAHRLTKAEEKRQKFQERMEAINNFNRLLQMTSLDNTAVPSFIPTTGNVFLDSMMGLTKAEGGSIYIKPENRGKFTALKERTGHSATWFKEHGTPAQKKMATFALNARHWKHGLGGNLFSGEENHNQQMITTGGAGYIPSINIPTKQEIRKRLYENINPYEYNDAAIRVAKAVIGNTKEETLDSGVYMPEVDDLWATYLQIPKSERHTGNKLVNEGHHLKVLPGTYKPTKGSNGKYYKLNLSEDSKKAIVDEAMGNTYEEGFDISPNPYNNHLGVKRIEKDPINIGQNRVATSYDRTLNWALRDFTVGRGMDNKGDYVSYYDLWDLSPYIISNKDQSFGIGKPFEIYDRIYLDDYYGVSKPTHATYLPEVTVTGRKKKAFGGNLFDDTTEDSQKMQVG